MRKTKIDWCDCEVNPVVGCPNGCPYCYARKINDRFHFISCWEKPQFYPERLKQFESQKAQRVFVNSMSDIAYWKEEWLIALFNAIQANKQHRYIALTKNYPLFLDKIEELTKTQGWDILDVFFVGQTFDKAPKNIDDIQISNFLNIEPILEEMPTDEWYNDYYGIGETQICGKAIIVGAETGNRKGKVIPKKEWIDELVRYADENKIPIFMKESLRAIMGDDFRKDKLPWEIER